MSEYSREYYHNLIILKFKDLRGKCREKRNAIRHEIREYVKSKKWDTYQYSISYCGLYAVAAVSEKERIGIDVEDPERVEKNREALEFLFKDQCDIEPIVRWCIHETIGKINGCGLAKPARVLTFEQIAKGNNSGICDINKGIFGWNVSYQFLDDNLHYIWVQIFKIEKYCLVVSMEERG